MPSTAQEIKETIHHRSSKDEVHFPEPLRVETPPAVFVIAKAFIKDHKLFIESINGDRREVEKLRPAVRAKIEQNLLVSLRKMRPTAV